jgi:hypothetical protein
LPSSRLKHGLRHIEQARQLDRGDWHDGLRRAVDHPLSPLAIAGVHRVLRLADRPLDWQAAAQGASLLAGMLLAIPLYLSAPALFGGSGAWLACLLVYLAPLPAHVMADGLSESTVLLFWTWGLWAALFLKAGSLSWLALALGFGGLAYLSRPEGLLLPAALVGGHPGGRPGRRGRGGSVRGLEGWDGGHETRGSAAARLDPAIAARRRGARAAPRPGLLPAGDVRPGRARPSWPSPARCHWPSFPSRRWGSAPRCTAAGRPTRGAGCFWA